MRLSGLNIFLLAPALLLAGFLSLSAPVQGFPSEPPAASPADSATVPPLQSGPASMNATDKAGAEAEKKPALSPQEPYPLLPAPPIEWQPVGKGMEVGTAVIYESRARQRDAVFVFVRIVPEEHKFALAMASHAGKPRSFADWSSLSNLKAGVNASMYLPDNITSTGYMRDSGSVNNAKVGNRLGAFFAAGRRDKKLPHATVVEKDKPGWREIIDDYDLVVQNYRLISGDGRILWPTGGPEHSIAALAVDDRGRILFILCQEPLTAVRFAFYLRSFPLGLGPVLYVEGGAQAGVFVRLDDNDKPRHLPGASAIAVDGGVVHVWKGRQSLLNLKGNPHAALPNIIGVKR